MPIENSDNRDIQKVDPDVSDTINITVAKNNIMETMAAVLSRPKALKDKGSGKTEATRPPSNSEWSVQSGEPSGSRKPRCLRLMRLEL